MEAFKIVVDLQFIVDNYDKVAWIGTKVEAKNAEMDCIAVDWGFRDKEELENTYFCEEVSELEDILEEMIHGQ